MSQRLLPRICESCAEPDPEAAQALAALGRDTRVTPRRAPGCADCGGRGHRGRAVAAELAIVDPRMRAMIAEGAGARLIEDRLRSEGARLLWDSAYDLVAGGLVSLSNARAILSV